MSLISTLFNRIVNGIKLYCVIKNTCKKIPRSINFSLMIVELKLGHIVNKVIIPENDLRVLAKLEIDLCLKMITIQR